MFEKQNMRVRYLKTLEKIRNFLLSRKSREFLIFLFFVLVSFSFWLLQVLNDDYETELENRLTELIESIDGAGKTKVMLTVDCGDENVYATDNKNGTVCQCPSV